MQVTPPKKIKFGDLKTRILNPSLTSNYLVEIQAPGGIGEKMSRMGANLTPWDTFDYVNIPCCEASLPGSSLSTIDISNDYRGISEKHAYRRLYDDTINFTFYVDATAGREYYVIKFFEGWLAYITNQNFDTIQNSIYDYRVLFPEQYYAVKMLIQKFERIFDSISDEAKRTPIKYEFYNAYPLSINSMPVSYDGSEVLKCSVDFSFSRYKLVRSDYTPSTGEQATNPNSPGNPDVPNPPVSNTDELLNSPSQEQYFRSDSIEKLERDFGLTEGSVARSIDEELAVQQSGRPPSGGFRLL
jgi:hypothetical protein